MKLIIFSSLVVLLVDLSVVFADYDSPIRHIVVLMMENRSFDNLLGWLKQSSAPNINGLTGEESQPRDPNDPTKGDVKVTRNGYDIAVDDPKHAFEDIAIQLNSNKMNGFVYDSIKNGLNETNPVAMFDEDAAPIINTLALEFAVFDNWFASIPTCTDPNRQFAMTGTSQGIIDNYKGVPYEQQTYFDYLFQHNRTFAGYYQDDYWCFGYFKDMRNPRISRNIHNLDDKFYSDAAAGLLPEFTWLQPRMSTLSEDKIPTWQHPDASVREGERLIKQIYEALRAGPAWEETLFIITYDEHGGFYDHVAPPSTGVPSPDEFVARNGYSFNSLGVRIPTIAISPWIAKGTIVHDALPGEQPSSSSAFESTSIMATANILLGLAAEGAPSLGNRMSWSNTFAGLVKKAAEPRKDCPMTLPELPPRSSNSHYSLQRLKPLNEHLESQLIFYCAENYPLLHAENKCPGRKEIMFNQGLASDWIAKEGKIFRDKLASA